MTTPAAEYTPTTDEVRNRHAYSRKMNGVPFHDEELAAHFDRWLEATIRQAKAEALREAAAEVYPRAAIWLRARASRIEAGE